MRKQFYAATFLSAAMVLAACEGDDGSNGTDGANGADGFNSLVATRDIPKGDAVCLGGGLALDSGLDTNRNDILDTDEVTATELLECEGTPTLRALHASPDAPLVNIWVNGATALTDVDYGQGSGFVPVVEENNVQVEAISPIGNLVVIDEDLTLDYNTETTVIAVDNVLGPVRALAITNASDSRITDGYFRAQVVHAAQAAPPVDVFVTPFDADLSASDPVNGVGTAIAFEEFSGQLEVPAGDYQIRITLDDDPSTVVYDSGEISLAAGADLMIVAVDNVGPGGSAVQLVVLDGTAASTLYDTNTPASAVAVHLSPDAPAVDLLADDNATAGDDALALTRNIAFPAACELANVPAPGDYTISVVANADNSIVATTFPLAVEQGDEATAIVSGFLTSGTPAITTIALGNDTRSVITEAKLRITHASPSTPPVDIYLVPEGTDIANEEPSFEDVPFGADTGQLSISGPTATDPAVYDAYVTLADDKTPAISITGLAFAGGEVLDVIARDPATDGSEGTLPLAFVIDYAAVGACPAP